MFRWRSKLKLSDFEIDWAIESFQWALLNLDSTIFFNQTELVLPSDRFFPDKISNKDEAPTAIMDQVRDLAFMSEWPIRLRRSQIGYSKNEDLLTSKIKTTRDIKFSNHKNAAIIEFLESDLKNPELLVARFSRALATYLVSHQKPNWPGGLKYQEEIVDVVTIFLGFGVFLINTSFVFQQFRGVTTQGWSASRHGKLGTELMIFVLSIFFYLKNYDASISKNYLKKSQNKMLYNCLKWIHTNECITKKLDRLKFDT